MNTPDSDSRVCDQCGAPLGRHTRDGLCSRCIARVSLLEWEDGEERSEVSDQGTSHGAGGGGHVPVPPTRDPASDILHPPGRTHFGDYELLEEIAHGGMGVVYRARQVSLKRIVAVKMLLFGQFAGKTAFDRFRAEAETAARLQHPNIVAIHGIGETDGQPYFSMDYVAGRNLADVVRDRPLPAHQAAGYVRKIALAVQYAHTQGVLHRDLKPANVLIDEADEPRITDFGLARRLVGDSELTLTGQVVGSPNFMPPEQGVGKKARVGPTSDVYGLGALLYYLLTARPPFVAETLEATLAQVLNTEPVEPRQLNPGLPLDLETICLKCLEKDPARRYASAGDLADELDRFLKGEPIQARPIGFAGKGWRWCRRKPVLAAMTAAVLTLLVTVTVVSLTAARRIAAEARRTEQNARALRLNLYVADMNVAHQAVLDNNFALARQLISKYLPEPQGTQDGTMMPAPAARQQDLRGWEWRYLWGLCRDDSLVTLRGHSNAVTCAAYSPDGKTLVTASFDRTVRVWDVATRRALRCLAGFANQLQRNSVVLSPDGKSLAVADGTDIHIFETTSWSRVRTLNNRTPPGFVTSLPIAFSPDGKILSCNADTEIRHWETTSWERLPSQPTNLVGEFTRLLAYSSDGRHFATSKDAGIVIWDACASPPSQRFLGRLYWPTSVAFSPDGQLVAAVGQADYAVVWDVEEGKEIWRLPTGPKLASAVAFSPDGRRLVTGGEMTRIWEMDGGRLMATLKGGQDVALSFSPDGRTLLSACNDGTARLWSALPDKEQGSLLTAGRPLCFSADSRVLAVLSTNNSVDYWDVRSSRMLTSFKLPVNVGQRDTVAASPDGELVAQVCTDGIVRIWQRDTGAQVADLMLQPAPKWPWLQFSPDSRLVAVSCDTSFRGGGGWTVVWDFHRGQRRSLPRADVYRPSFSRDGRFLATGFGTNAQLWSVPDLKPLVTLRGHRSTINGSVFSPEGELLASIGRDGEIILWEVATGRPRLRFSMKASSNNLEATGFSPDGRTLASGGGGSPELWNVASGRVVLPFGRKHRYVLAPIFSPDGNTLVMGGGSVLLGPVPLEIFQAPSLAEIEAVEKAEQQLQ